MSALLLSAQRQPLEYIYRADKHTLRVSCRQLTRTVRRHTGRSSRSPALAPSRANSPRVNPSLLQPVRL